MEWEGGRDGWYQGRDGNDSRDDYLHKLWREEREKERVRKRMNGGVGNSK